ncbi:polysaccharide deacetylase family protein [Nocardia sp. alder85J]|uniref:polysaccharide deacetylase family protein n=1 Tax=Nocardia sp. alder85J TaxID=2862949 RepID=UPI001CD605A8|nr:polysaccharide deacetylase family protein [Nocardia sp. alder85J]MCX4098230.1 polysaccharide deacetylase family protein [Nocardia sp. alder85J]
MVRSTDSDVPPSAHRGIRGADLNRRTLFRGAALGATLVATGAAVATAAPFPSLSAGDDNNVPWADPKLPAPQGVLTRLPGDGNQLAFTVDDGTTSEVVAAYARMAVDNGFRLTFFPNGVYPSWAENAGLLRPLLDSGQILFGNHTWSHPDITKLSHDQLVDQITRNEQFLQNTFGVSGRPFFRPPYGNHNATTDRIAADLGYQTITLWSDTIGDGRVLGEAEVTNAASHAFQPQNIVLGHANQRSVGRALPSLAGIIHDRGLATVNLGDVFAT